MHLCYTPLISWIADGIDLIKAGHTLAATAMGHYSSSCCPDRSEQHSSVGQDMRTTGSHRLSSPKLKLYPSPASSFSFTTYLSTKSCSKIYMASSVVFLSLFEQVHALLNVKFSLFHHLGCSIQRHCTVLYGSLKRNKYSYAYILTILSAYRVCWFVQRRYDHYWRVTYNLIRIISERTYISQIYS